MNEICYPPVLYRTVPMGEVTYNYKEEEPLRYYIELMVAAAETISQECLAVCLIDEDRKPKCVQYIRQDIRGVRMTDIFTLAVSLDMLGIAVIHMYTEKVDCPSADSSLCNAIEDVSYLLGLEFYGYIVAGGEYGPSDDISVLRRDNFRKKIRQMHEIKVPIVYVEEIQDGRRDAYGRYTAMSPIDVIRTVQDTGIDRDREYIYILAMGNNGLAPLQIRLPQDPEQYRVQEIYIPALAIEASALVAFHNIPHGIAALEYDTAFYEEIRDAGNKIGIPLLEHIILNGNMLSGISDMPIVSYRWKDLGTVRCSPIRQPSCQDGRGIYIRSARLPGTMIGMKKPFTIGI